MRASPIGLLILLLLSACGIASHTPRFYAKTLQKEIENSPVFARSFTGFTLLDPETGRTLCDVQGDHYFTPASTLKILTMATCLAVLGDSVPGMQIIRAEDEFIFRGTGDPTFLHPFFQNWQPCRDTLLAHPFDSIRYLPHRFPTKRFGPGWAWDDYNEYYQAERSELPVYGNCVKVTPIGLDSINVEPNIFRERMFLLNAGYRPGILRIEYDNSWYGTNPPHEQFFPFTHYRVDNETILSDTLQRNVIDISWTEHPYQLLYPTETLYSTPLDTVLRRMMYQSDNFIAEQMLIVCAGVKYDTLAQEKIIRWARDTLFAPPITNPQSPRWVDGSGLSRYNLITPRYFAGVLSKLWKEQNHDRLLSLFPTAGAPETTLDWWQPVPTKPWLFAKTGSMSGVQCMSGYLRTKRGKILIFSFMNNNFVGSGKPWRLEMQRILELAGGG